MTGWQPHVEVWVLVAGLAALSVYATRVIGPKVVPDGEPVVTRRQRVLWVGALAVLWVSSDWPVHDIAEEHLYFIHMAQHLALTYVFPALVLLATPKWLARLVIGDGWFAGSVVRRLCHPLVAGVLFNAMVVFSHWPAVVNASVESGPLHYLLHTLLVGSALLMWMPVCGPLPELRLSPPGQMIYLFLMSIVPTIPAAWLMFAEGAVYDVYDRPFQLWGISVTTDQQLAGILMKLGAGLYLWALIVVLFFRWYADQEREEAAARRGPTVPVPPDDGGDDGDVLTWEQVQAELQTIPPGPREP